MTQARSRQSWFSKEGSAFPLGATWLPDEKAYNFALYSKHATRVTLLLFGEDETTAPLVEVEFNHKINRGGSGIAVWPGIKCVVPATTPIQ